MGKPSTVVFWGAGATAKLGMRTTAAQSDYLLALAGVADAAPAGLAERVEDALGSGADARQRRLMVDLLTILGDGTGSATLHDPTGEQLAAMGQNWWPGANGHKLRERIGELRLAYDWPALQDVLRVCPGAAAGNLKINDLFNMLDMHAPLGHGFRTEHGTFLDARRLMGAKTALRMILHAMFYIDWENCVGDRGRPLETYEAFAEWLGRKMYNSEPSFSGRLDRAGFIRGDIAFVSLNYDPIGLWAQFVANRRLNRAPDVEKVDGASRRIQLYHDMGHFIPSRRIEPAGRPALWYPMNEASAQRINEIDAAGSERIRLSKFLFPHGCLCWRECPDCGKLSAYHGDEWTLRSPSPLPPPPLRGFERRSAYPDLATLDPLDRHARVKESDLWSEGMVDARACLHCHTITTTEHTQTVMQSSFKQTPPSFIDEIQRDLRAIVMQADHVILMGYSLPPDDVDYRAFFAARRRRTASGTPVRCTVVGFDHALPPLAGPGGIDPDVVARQPAVASAREIFGEDNVRFCGEGVPDAFCGAPGVLSETKLDALFEWRPV